MTTYKATGINIKTMPLGETDRLITILTPEWGLVRAVAPGSRKPKSRLRGRMELFTVNELLIVKGRSLDKIIQAETLLSYPGLSKDLGKLTVSQYWAEIVLALGLSDQPQEELYHLFNEHLQRLQTLNSNGDRDLAAAHLLSHLSHGILHLLNLGGLSPQLQQCCISGEAIAPYFQDPHWQVGIGFEVGGLVRLPLQLERSPNNQQPTTNNPLTIHDRLNALELQLLQSLLAADLPPPPPIDPSALKMAWIAVERLLRNYTQYHLGKSIRSVSLLDILY